MKFCNEHRDEIVFEGRNCPACDEITDLKNTINDLTSKITDLEDYISMLEDKE